MAANSEKFMERWIAYGVMSSAILIGGVPLIAFGVFLFVGPFNIVKLAISNKGALMINAGLSLLFFIQHSLMIRQSFKKKVIRFMPEAYFSAFFAIASGIVLMLVVLCWQKTTCSFGDAKGVLHLILRLLFLAAAGGCYWGARALGFFDPFGRRATINHLRSTKPKPVPFTVKGPYRWVRHPLYFFILVMIWTYPHLTADRLLFNVLWTIWLIVGSILEERDLVKEFGREYRDYQSKVPMLIPIRIFK